MHAFSLVFLGAATLPIAQAVPVTNTTGIVDWGYWNVTFDESWGGGHRFRQITAKYSATPNTTKHYTWRHDPTDGGWTDTYYTDVNFAVNIAGSMGLTLQVNITQSVIFAGSGGVNVVGGGTIDCKMDQVGRGCSGRAHFSATCISERCPLVTTLDGAKRRRTA